VLARLAKGHTHADVVAVAGLMRDLGLTLHPTFVAFTPWITLEGYRDLLRGIAALGWVRHVSPVQLAIRLLIPRGSLLLELDEVRALVGSFDDEALVHPWRHPDRRVDALQVTIEHMVREATSRDEGREEIFARAWAMAGMQEGEEPRARVAAGTAEAHGPVPYLTEPWYC